MDQVVIVSGSVRSGTSMMMRMLWKGGMRILADERTMKHQPGHDNKYGDFEVRSYRWISDNCEKIAGCAFKIVVMYGDVLEEVLNEIQLETDFKIKVIFMNRPVKAIQASLKKQGVDWEPSPELAISLGRKILERFDLSILDVNYDDAIDYPVATCQKVIDFVDMDLDIEEMVAAIDPNERHHGG